MCSSLVLTQWDFNKQFILQVNALAYGMGTILSQEGDHQTPTLAQCTKPALYPIAYYSATFTATEQNYNIYKWELLAIMKALAHWWPYSGWTKVPFIIQTDHANLQYWKALRNLNQWTAWWHANLQEYDYQLEYIPSKTNTVADALSRPANTDQGQEDNKNITVLAHQQICTIHTTLRGQTIVPNVKELKRAIVSKADDTPTARHPGQDETLWWVQQDYWWAGIKKWIGDYVKGCSICQQTKANTHKQHTPIYCIPTTIDMLPFKTMCHTRLGVAVSVPHSSGLLCILCTGDQVC